MVQVYHWPDQHRAFSFRAFKRGATMEQARSWTRPTQSWDISGDCVRPIRRELSTAQCGVPVGARGATYARFKERYYAQHLDLAVRCRKCDNCRRVRSWGMRLRMTAEIDTASRTWFTTLTLAPDRQSLARMAAIRRLDRGGVRWGDLHPDEQFAEIVKEISPELTKYVKRVRKNSSASFRYILVTEKHKTGLPHFHMLWHEADPDARIKWKHLDAAWRLGFSMHKLVIAEQGKRTASYVAKYLSKSVLSRVRCSKGYGHVDGLRLPKAIGETVKNLTPSKHPDILSPVQGQPVFLGSVVDERRRIPSGVPEAVKPKAYCGREEAGLSNADTHRCATCSTGVPTDAGATSSGPDNSGSGGRCDRCGRDAVIPIPAPSGEGISCHLLDIPFD